jgi:hypothetical protein
MATLCNMPTFFLPSPPDILSILLSLLPALPAYPTIQLPSLPCPLDALPLPGSTTPTTVP